jgi:hypothetical protein
MTLRALVGAVALVVAVVTPVGATQSKPAPPDAEKAALSAVGKALDASNKLGVTASDLRTKANKKGEGLFVYVPRTDYSGVKRYLLWLVLDGTAYALNGPSKTATPSLPWPRETDDKTWNRTGLNKYIATDAISLVWGRINR